MASYYPLPVSASIGVAAFTPLVCSFIVSFRLVSWFQHGSYLGTHHVCSPAHWQIGLALSLASHDGTGAVRLINSTFSFPFCLGVILIYSPRSYEAGAFFSFGPAWTASGLGQ